MDREQGRRWGWVRVHQEIGNAGIACRRCGISRPTLRTWLRRYEALGVEGLKSRSRKPGHSPGRQVLAREEALILTLRRDRRLGIKQLRNELQRLHGLRLSVATLHKVLTRHGEQRRPPSRLVRKPVRRYSRPIPGDRVQMDVCKIAPGQYHYSAVDDCTRYRVVGLYPRRTAANTLRFLEKVVEEMPFPIQRVQTDRGREFFAAKVQDQFRAWAIKFRPIKPRSPHLNGKVERGHRTDLEEFYATVDLAADDLADQLQLWQHYYNWDRLHSALGGKTPIDRCCELLEQTPLREEVEAAYDPARERFREPHYVVDAALASLKRSL